MALDTQVVPMPLLAGIDAKTDDKQLKGAAVTVLENAVFNTHGRFRKRNGFAPIGDEIPGTAQFNVGALFAHKNQLLASDGQTLNTYVEADDTWHSVGNMPAVVPSQRQIARGDIAKEVQDSAIHESGVTCFAWREGGVSTSGVIKATLIDSETGAVITAPATLSAALGAGQSVSHVKVAALGDYLYIFWMLTDSGASSVDIKFRTIYVGDYSMTPALTFGSVKYGSDCAFDLCVFESQMFLAWHAPDSGGNPQLKLALLDPSSPFSASASASYTETISNCLCIFPQYRTSFPTVLTVAWDDGADAKYRQFNTDLTSVAAATTFAAGVRLELVSGISIYQSTATYVIGCYDDGGVDLLVKPFQIGGTATSGLAATRGVTLAGKAFKINDNTSGTSVGAQKVYFPVFFGRSPDYVQATYFVVDLFGSVVAKLLPSVAGLPPINNSYVVNVLPEVNAVSETEVQFAAQINARNDNPLDLFNLATVRVIGINEIRLDFKPTQAPGRVEMANAVLVGGGVVREFDGAQLVEHGFHVSPDSAGTPVNTGTAHTYGYVACYEWTDNQGSLHRSAPSAEGVSQMKTANPIGNGSGGTETVSVEVQTLRLSDKASSARVVLYRTKDGESTYFRAGSTANVPSADIVTIVDTISDGSLENSEQLYCPVSTATAGVQQNGSPPASLIMVGYRNRVIAVDALNPLSLNFSKTVALGYPLEFSPFFAMTVDESGGDITGLGVLDDRLIVFKADRIFFITGQGPDNTGGDNDFSDAKLIPSDVGCISHRSVVTTPAGLLFQSRRGICLLDRSMNVSFIGAPIESLTDGASVTAATLVSNSTQVRFSLAAGNQTRLAPTTTNSTLVYDYLIGQWSVFKTFAVGDACLWRDLHTFLSPDGCVYQEVDGSFADESLLPEPTSSYVSMRLTTGWLNVAALNGYQRLRKMLVLGSFFSAHRLVATIYYDYDTTDYETLYATATAETYVTGYSNIVVEQPPGSGHYVTVRVPTTANKPQQDYSWKFRPARQKCKAIKIDLYDEYTSTNGQSLDLTALSFEVGVKKGTAKLPASKSMVSE